MYSSSLALQTGSSIWREYHNNLCFDNEVCCANRREPIAYLICNRQGSTSAGIGHKALSCVAGVGDVRMAHLISLK